MNNREASRAVSKSATPNNRTAICGVFIIPRKRDKWKMVSDWAFIGIFFFLSIFFPLVPILAGTLLGPHKPGQVKGEPYECGITPRGPAHIQFRASYYLYALVFLIFDVEAVFLFPWAVAYAIGR